MARFPLREALSARALAVLILLTVQAPVLSKSHLSVLERSSCHPSWSGA